jgi:glutathione S-transferase
MKLVSANTSPYARKVRIALYEKNIDCDLIEDTPWNPDTCTSRFNPLEKLPILVLDNGETVYDSRFILEWLERHYPEPPLLSRDIGQALDAKRLEVLSDGVLDALVLLFWEISRPIVSEPWADRQRRKIVGGFREIARLIGAKQYAVGDRFGHGDIVVGAAIGAFELMHARGDHALLGGFYWQDAHPSLKPYHEGLEERRSFLETRPRFFDNLQAAT